MKKAIVMNPSDNVATALMRIESDNLIAVISHTREILKEIKAKQDIPFGHKVALSDIRAGDEVIKYGELIGHASRDIETGDYVHIHNVKSDRMELPELWYRQEV